MQEGTGVAREQPPVSASPSRAVDGRASGQHGQPAPKYGLPIEAPGVAHHAAERFLQGVTRRLVVAAGDDEEVAQQPVEVARMELPERLLVPGGEAAGEGGELVWRIGWAGGFHGPVEPAGGTGERQAVPKSGHPFRDPVEIWWMVRLREAW